MNAIARTEPLTGQVVAADANSIMDVISRAAADPNTDVDKLERLVGLYERITERGSKAAYAAALAEMQPKLPIITERGKISTDKGVTVQSRYALWEDINEAIGPVLAEYGFALSFRTGSTPEGRITVTGVLSHREGHQEETTMTLPHDSSGSKNAVQAVGSSTSYGKRYTAMALLNITSRGEDDDGKKGGDPGPISNEQLMQLQQRIIAASADPVAFAKYLKVENLSDLPAAKFDAALLALKAKERRA